jgi:hypothetical protein
VTLLVETLTGSLYTLTEQEDGVYLTANNVPSQFSEKMPGDVATKLQSVFPWPPKKGAMMFLTYPSPKPGHTRVKRTSTVVKITALS